MTKQTEEVVSYPPQGHADMFKAVYDPDEDGLIAVAQLEATLDKYFKGQGLGSPCVEGVPPGATEAWLHAELMENKLILAEVGDVTKFQMNPATGIFTTDPQNINNGSTASPADARAVDQYAEVNFNTPLFLDQWRQYGNTDNVGDGTWKLQYWNLVSNTWVDWVTGIATRTLGSWSGFTTETLILTTKIQLICTAVDSGTYGSNMNELEIKLSTPQDGTAVLFRANPATGTFTTAPENINDGSIVNLADARAEEQYAEIDFGTPLILKQWKQYGHTSNNGDGRWKLQYWDSTTSIWVDWVTDIPTKTTTGWSSFTTETLIITTKFRLVCTTVDGGVSGSIMPELEVIY